MTTTITPFKQELQVVEEKLKSYFDGTRYKKGDSRSLLGEAMSYSISAKAKRIRPLLTIATYQLFKSDITPILPLACAIEMVHTYSLIHDDLPAMDNDDFRRGQMSCHKKYGEAIAILAGDTLHTYAFEITATELPKFFSAEKVCEVMGKMSVAFGIEGMAGGQVMDLKSENLKLKTQETQQDQQEAYLRNTHIRKTGKVLQSCITLPVILVNKDIGNEKERVSQKLSQFGSHMGLLFQIVDDILDEIGSSDQLGKSLHKDKAQEKYTYVKHYGLEGAKEQAKAKKEQAQKLLKELESKYKVNQLNDILEMITNQINI